MTDTDALRALLTAAGVREKPWELYEAEGFTYCIVGVTTEEEYDEENLPCRITTGGDFDDLDSARLAVAAVNALPALLDKADTLAALVAAKDAQERSLGLQPITDGKPGSVTAAFDRARRLVEDER